MIPRMTSKILHNSTLILNCGCTLAIKHSHFNGPNTDSVCKMVFNKNDVYATFCNFHKDKKNMILFTETQKIEIIDVDDDYKFINIDKIEDKIKKDCYCIHSASGSIIPCSVHM